MAELENGTSGAPTATATEKSLNDDVEEKLDFVLRYARQTERGVVLASCAFLDEILRGALESRLHVDDKIVNDMFSSRGPLSSTDAKIKLAYLLGIVGKDALRDLLAVNTIRNRFAHDHKIDSFSDPKVSGQLENIKILDVTAKAEAYHGDKVKSSISALKDSGVRVEHPREKYLAAVHLLCAVIRIGMRNKIELPTPEW